VLRGSRADGLGRRFNVLRLAFHPEGLASRTLNLGEWCAASAKRLHRNARHRRSRTAQLYQE